jgi:hypothetical protein
MDESEAISIANRAHAMKPWAKASRDERLEAGRHITDVRKQNLAAMPRLQDTRTTQVLSKNNPQLDESSAGKARRITIWDESSLAGRWWLSDGSALLISRGQQLAKYILGIELYAEDYDAAGQAEKAGR